MSYYLSKKSKLLKDFDKTANLMQDYLVKHYGKDSADTLYQQTRQQYEALIPEIPYIKGIRAGALNSFLLIVAKELALYKTMKKQDKELGEIWQICHQAIKLRMAKFPKFKRWLLKKLMYSKFLLRRVKKRAEGGEQLKFGDFEIRYLIGEGKNFDWGVDYVACGHCTFLKAQSAEEFARISTTILPQIANGIVSHEVHLLTA